MTLIQTLKNTSHTLYMILKRAFRQCAVCTIQNFKGELLKSSDAVRDVGSLLVFNNNMPRPDYCMTSSMASSAE